MKTVFNRNSTQPDGLGGSRALINPWDVIKPVPGFPQTCVSTFSAKIIQRFAAMEQTEVIAGLYTANGVNPVYKITYGGREFGLYLSLVGAPASVCGLEEVIAMGARKFVFFGSCGILNEEAVGNRLIVPTGAVRDEGTSYHYLPPSAEIEADEETTSLLKDCLTRCGCPFVTGKMWTNDAIYRETLDLVRERRDAGCIGTDMEYSALLAAARFRGVGFAQFFYGADSLDNDVWQPRDLTDYGFGNADKYMTLALEAALRL